MTARSSSTSAIRPIPSCRPTAGSSPASSSRWTRCPRRSGAMSAIPGTARDPGADVPGLPHAGSAGLLQQGGPLVHPRKAGRRPGGQQAMDPYYTIMKLPGAEKEEFILLAPFTPSMKDNMSAWMAARCDAPHYGKVIVYKFPKQKLVYGPRQIEARIDQDTIDLPAIVALAAAGIERDPGESARDPDREVDPLRRIPLPGRLQRPAPRAQEGDRRLRQHHRHGGERSISPSRRSSAGGR